MSFTNPTCIDDVVKKYKLVFVQGPLLPPDPRLRRSTTTSAKSWHSTCDAPHRPVGDRSRRSAVVPHLARSVEAVLEGPCPLYP